ncbi:hypothetical protein GQ55_8G120500 [Panicum hallii var. hallii]|uniref:DUF4283 domain-containing protein n=1 Tax=Panicum hallii var. hallii TaxID=1504633 RepID=A0A2T7CMS7_9POAL|nr:hypothetical protein GQ55_8G120500 [Panicum hallii var. hallii]
MYGYRVKISKTNIDPAGSSILQSPWIKIDGIPGFTKEEVVREIASLVVEPIKVDGFSLLRNEPVRVHVNCRDRAKLRGFVEIFFNGVGYEIKIATEGSSNPTRGKDGPFGSGKFDDKKDGDDKRNSDNQEHKRVDKSEDHSKHFDKELDGSQGESQEDNMEDLIRDGSPMDVEFSYEIPLAAFHPELGLLQVDSLGR